MCIIFFGTALRMRADGEAARHGGVSCRVVERLAGLHSCACGHCYAAFEGEGRRRAPNVGADGPALPRLLECDVCTTKVLFRSRRKPIDTVHPVTSMM